MNSIVQNNSAEIGGGVYLRSTKLIENSFQPNLIQNNSASIHSNDTYRLPSGLLL